MTSGSERQSSNRDGSNNAVCQLSDVVFDHSIRSEATWEHAAKGVHEAANLDESNASAGNCWRRSSSDCRQIFFINFVGVKHVEIVGIGLSLAIVPGPK